MSTRHNSLKTKYLHTLIVVLIGALSLGAGVDRENKSINPEPVPTPDEALERYTTNITRLANLNPAGVSPFVGRVQDQVRLLTVLSQQGTQVVYLIGPAGAGKTALVESIARELKGVEILDLDLGKLQAGAHYKGDFEGRMRGLMSKLIASNGQYILFVDEFHQLMKIEGMADLLKPALARGTISFIGATTIDEYREHVEKDTAMTSRGQKVTIDPLSKEEALQMLRARKASLSQKYGVNILDATLKTAVDLAARYYAADPISRRALQIVDETMSRISSYIKYGALTTRVLEDQIKQNKNERASLQADLPYLKDAESELAKQRIDILSAQIDSDSDKLKIQQRGITPSGHKLGIVMFDMHQKESEIEKLKTTGNLTDKKVIQQIEALVNEVKSIREREIPKMRAAWEAETKEIGRERPIGVDDVRLTVSADRNVPMDGIGSTAQERVAKFISTWNTRIFGQPEALNQIQKIIQAREMGIEPNTEKPLVFMLNGATGVGKTESALAIASGILSDERGLIKIPMGGHDTERASWALFGAVQGHVSAEKGGILTEAVRNKPFSVVLLDEYEKAHRSLDSTFLEIMDKGEIKDNSGRYIDFRNCIIIITTNITAEWVFDRIALNTTEIEQKYGYREGELSKLTSEQIDKTVTEKLLLLRFAKEFLARVDLKLNYNPINMEAARELSKREFKRQADALESKQGIRMNYTQAAVDALADIVTKSSAGGREAQTSRRGIITHQILLEALDPKNNVKRGGQLDIDFKATIGNLAGQFTVSHAGKVLHTVPVVMPVRLPTPSLSQDAAANYRKASGSEEAAKSQIVDSKGAPIRGRGK